MKLRDNFGFLMKIIINIIFCPININTLIKRTYFLTFQVTRYMKFDDKKGFQMHASIFLELNILIFCTASKNNIIEHRLIPNPWESKFIFFLYNNYFLLL